MQQQPSELELELGRVGRPRGHGGCLALAAGIPKVGAIEGERVARGAHCERNARGIGLRGRSEDDGRTRGR